MSTNTISTLSIDPNSHCLISIIIYPPIIYLHLGQGAFCNGKPIKVAEGGMNEAVINCGYPVGMTICNPFLIFNPFVLYGKLYKVSTSSYLRIIKQRRSLTHTHLISHHIFFILGVGNPLATQTSMRGFAALSSKVSQ